MWLSSSFCWRFWIDHLRLARKLIFYEYQHNSADHTESCHYNIRECILSAACFCKKCDKCGSETKSFVDDETKAKREEAAKKAEEIAKELAEQSADVAKAGLEGLKAGVDAAIKAYKETRNK